MERILSKLKTLGLSDKQAKCYVALVELGEATAYQIANKAGIKRPITYVILDELRLKGLVLKVQNTKKQLFIAKAPDELFAEYEEKLRDAKRTLPDLLAMVANNSRKVRLMYFDGNEGIQKALEYNVSELINKEVLAFYGKGKGPVPDMYHDYNQKLSKQGTRMRGFAPDHVSLKEFRDLDKKYGWEIKKLNESEFSSEVSVEVTDGFVRIILYKDKQAVVIENDDFAHMMRQTFEMLWKAQDKK